MSKFNGRSKADYLMTVNGCKVGLNMPPALQSAGSADNEVAHSLPPYRKRSAFLVDKYPACPASWLRSSGRIKSYFVPVVEGAGVWLDLNSCLEGIPQHVAAVVSIQGINAVTGLPVTDAGLEQYIDVCPKHKKPFGADRLCKACGFKWPKQNYLSSAGTPEGQFWLDGFRSADGAVRQYVMTSKTERGVAKAIIGNDRVFALGISFFLSKEKRPAPPASSVPRAGMHIGQTIGHLAPDSLYDYKQQTTGWNNTSGNLWLGNSTEDDCGLAAWPPDESSTPDLNHWKQHFMSSGGAHKISNSRMLKSSGMSGSCSSMSAKLGAVKCCVESDVPQAAYMMSVQPDMGGVRRAAIAVKSMEIAAGAKINQRVWDDPNNLDAYMDKPEGIIVVNYCSEEEAEAIIAAGMVDVEGSREGFLTGLPVGEQAAVA
jgi:hypothetical protein